VHEAGLCVMWESNNSKLPVQSCAAALQHPLQCIALQCSPSDIEADNWFPQLLLECIHIMCEAQGDMKQALTSQEVSKHQVRH
jgi:hypothetical protein